MTLYKGTFKFVLGWLAVFTIRMIPFRAPNIEPVLATLMPFSKRYGAGGAFLFGSLSIALFDVATNKVGTWTLITAVAYGLVGIASYFFFRQRESTRLNYVVFGVVGTIAYDALTGLTTGPLLFGQSFREAFLGQIPFTLWHLLGTTLFSLILSPAIYQWVVANERLEVPILRILALFR